MRTPRPTDACRDYAAPDATVARRHPGAMATPAGRARIALAMADPDQLRHAIEAQEQLRGAVPDDVIDATIAALRAQLGTVPEGRRRQVTVLFADVSGFTAMSEHRDA